MKRSTTSCLALTADSTEDSSSLDALSSGLSRSGKALLCFGEGVVELQSVEVGVRRRFEEAVDLWTHLSAFWYWQKKSGRMRCRQRKSSHSRSTSSPFSLLLDGSLGSLGSLAGPLGVEVRRVSGVSCCSLLAGC